MKIYKTQSEIEADIKDGELFVDGDVKFEVSFNTEARLRVAGDINAWNINAGDINAWNIDARDINARNIDAGNINAWNIDAGDISFFAVAFACVSFKCKSIVARRINSKYFCLDGEVEITG